jgi:hypothetical protein
VIRLGLVVVILLGDMLISPVKSNANRGCCCMRTRLRFLHGLSLCTSQWFQTLSGSSRVEVEKDDVCGTCGQRKTTRTRDKSRAYGSMTSL